jgi:hypothetical protein
MHSSHSETERQQREGAGHLRKSMRVSLTRGGLAVRLTALCLLFPLAAGVYGFATRASAQEQTYTSPKVDYVVSLPSPVWRLVGEPDDIHQHTEFIYGDRNDGFLRIRKETLPEGTTIREFARQDVDQKEHFLPGYIGGGKEEPFSGRLSGFTVPYEYTQAGKPMAGRSYYLQADSHTVYVLRFTGMRDKLARIRNQTDLIARSFKLK